MPDGTIWQRVERREWLLTVHGFSEDTLDYLRGKYAVEHIEVGDLGLEDVSQGLRQGAEGVGMKTLLWKDIRVNRVVLWYAAVSLAGLHLAAAAVNVIGQLCHGTPVKQWPEMIGMAAIFSLVLSLAGGGGCLARAPSPPS